MNPYEGMTKRDIARLEIATRVLAAMWSNATVLPDAAARLAWLEAGDLLDCAEKGEDHAD